MTGLSQGVNAGWSELCERLETVNPTWGSALKRLDAGCMCFKTAIGIRAWERQADRLSRLTVDIDKGGSIRPNYRSRFVCQETRWRSTIDVEDLAATFAATSLYEAFRLQLRLLMTGRRRQRGVDISRAHFHSPLARVVFVTINGKVYKLLKAMYGLLDGGASFDRKVLDVMNLVGVSLSKFSICVKAQNSLVRLVRWGADFSLTGRRSFCKAFRDDLGKALSGKGDSSAGAQRGDRRCAGSNRL